MQTSSQERRRHRREIVIPPAPRRQRKLPTTARVLPKPRPRREKPLERLSRLGAPSWALESKAEALLGRIFDRAHVAGMARGIDGRRVLQLQLELPESVFRALCLFGIEREDLELEQDDDQLGRGELDDECEPFDDIGGLDVAEYDPDAYVRQVRS